MIPMIIVARTINASVGVGGFNRAGDVSTVQDLLNLVPPSQGGPSKLLNVDGLCFGASQEAIKQFQRVALGMTTPDGRVDPGGRTLTKLQQLEASFGSRRFTIERFELRSLPDGRDSSAADRFYEISAVGSQRSMIYFCSQVGDRFRHPGHVLRQIGGRIGEGTTFTTRVAHSIAGFQCLDALDSEVSSDANNVTIALSLSLSTELLNLRIPHTWIIPTSEPGVPSSLRGQFRPVGVIG